MRPHKVLRYPACIAALALTGSPARADDANDLEALLEEPVVSTASKTPESQSVAPATSTIITAEDLRRFGIHSLDEAINFLSLGMVTSNPLHAVDVGARGVLLTSDFGNHVLLLVDGHVLNEQWDGTAYFERGAAIPFELIDHIEVILGPGSVLYGSNAMLGVINVITKRASDYAGIHVIGESEIPISYRLAGGVGHSFKLFGVRSGVTTQVEYYSQDGPGFRFGPQLGGTWGGVADKEYYTRVPAGYLRLVIGDLELGLRGAMYKRATPYMNGFNQFSGDFNDPDSYEIDRWLSIDLKYTKHLGSIATLSSRLYGDTYDYQQYLNDSVAADCLPGQDRGCRIDVIGISRWAGLEVQGSFDWLHNARLTTLVGTDARLRFVGSRQDSVDLVTDQNPGSYGAYTREEGSVALYAEQIVRPLDWMTVNAGARFDADERFGSRVSPRAAIAFVPWRGGTLKAVYAEAFRAPTAFESFYGDPQTQIVPDSLKPETVRSVEASIEQRFKGHRMLAGVFRSWWYDMVLLEALSGGEIAGAVASGQLTPGVTEAYQYRNVSRIDNYGFNATSEGVVASRFHYGLNVTGAYTRRTFEDGRDPLPLTVAPQFFGNARVAYDLGGKLPTVGVAASYQGRRPADRAFDGGFTPVPYAPAQLELRATLTGQVPLVTGLSYRMSAGYAFASRSAYVAGPVQAATPEQPQAELAPVDQVKFAIGLQYDFKL